MSMKENYQKTLNKQLEQWSAQIDTLKAKADKAQAEAEAQLEYNKEIEELRSMQEAASNKLAELSNASDSAWEDLKAGMDNTWDSINNALKSATAKFK